MILASLLAIAAPLHASSSFSASGTTPVNEFPALPSQEEYLGIPDTMSIAVQEDMFGQRELLEGFLGENRVAQSTAVDYADQYTLLGKLGGAARRIDIDRAKWRMERVALSGDMARRMSEISLKYEEVNLIKLRVLADEKVPRATLLRLQVEIRTMLFELAGIRLQRAQLDDQFYRNRVRELQYLADRGMAGLEDLLTETIAHKQALANVTTETRRVALTRAALEYVKRQANH
jgi:hypothetical protein